MSRFSKDIAQFLQQLSILFSPRKPVTHGPGNQAQLEDVAEPRTAAAMASHVEPEPLEPLVEPPVEPLRAPPQSSRSRRARVLRSGGTGGRVDAGCWINSWQVHLVPGTG